jgi:hypothetical protein
VAALPGLLSEYSRAWTQEAGVRDNKECNANEYELYMYQCSPCCA